MIRYGFTGNRFGMSDKQKTQIRGILQKDIDDGKKIEVHHGDCVGSDADFHKICEEMKISIIIHPPSDNKLRAFCKSETIYSTKDYLIRNQDIVNESEQILACPVDGNEVLRSGTWSTIRYGRKMKKIVHIIV